MNYIFQKELMVAEMKSLQKTVVAMSVLISAVMVSALPQGASDVKNSTITNTNERVTVRAEDGSNVNTGIQIKNSTVSKSQISNTFSGNIRADNSTVNTGIKADGATIDKAKINVDTRANIYAKNADVNTGVNLTGAQNAEVSTKVRAGTIDASNSTVKVGSVEGDVSGKKIGTSVTVGNVDANNRNYSLGSVNSVGMGGLPDSHGGTPGRSAVSIGNVTVDSAQVREVKTSVGNDDFSESLRVKHKAKIYKEQGGVDPTGTKNVYVSSKERQKTEKYGGSAGDSYVDSSDYKVKKVKTVVE
jgi:hypothetical protein